MTDTSTESVAGWLARLKAERDALKARAEATEAKLEQVRADADRKLDAEWCNALTFALNCIDGGDIERIVNTRRVLSGHQHTTTRPVKTN